MQLNIQQQALGPLGTRVSGADAIHMTGGLRTSNAKINPQLDSSRKSKNSVQKNTVSLVKKANAVVGYGPGQPGAAGRPGFAASVANKTARPALATQAVAATRPTPTR